MYETKKYHWKVVDENTVMYCSHCFSEAPVRPINEGDPGQGVVHLCQLCDTEIPRAIALGLKSPGSTNRIMVQAMAQMGNAMMDRLLSRWDSRARAVQRWRCDNVFDDYPDVKAIYELGPGDQTTVTSQDLQAVADKIAQINQQAPSAASAIAEDLAKRQQLRLNWIKLDHGEFKVTFIDPREPKEPHE